MLPKLGFMDEPKKKKTVSPAWRREGVHLGWISTPTAGDTHLGSAQLTMHFFKD